MINIETLLSSFDERGTLLKWLKAVEKALNEATLTSVDVITISSTEIKLKFIFEDDTTIETPTITLPKGDKGEDGVGISNVTIDANNHLIVTLTDKTEIDAGEIDVTSGVVVDSAISSTSENPVQNKVIYNALNDKASQADMTALTIRVGNVEGDIGTIEAQLTNKANASDVYTKSEANNLLAGKQNALTTSSVNDGTIDKSIGFDSQGNIVKGNGGGGGGNQIYLHEITISINSFDGSFYLINDVSSQITSIADCNNGFAPSYSGYNGNIILSKMTGLPFDTHTIDFKNCKVAQALSFAEDSDGNKIYSCTDVVTAL